MIHTQPYSLLGNAFFGLSSANPPSKLVEQVSPVLPMLYDRSLLPADLCEMQYLKMVQCENRMGASDEENLCSYPITLFLECKTKRVDQV